MVMNVSEAVKKRRSIRSYQDHGVEEDKLTRVLGAGRLAPSARNMQEWKFIVVREKETRAKLAEAAKGQAFVGEAPVVIVACGTVTDCVMPCGQLTYPIDVSIAVDHMTLQAVEEGLGTCWIGAFYEEEVKKILAIPPEVRVVVMMTLGYPADLPGHRPRKDMEDIVVHERWG